jgi:hexosaminidase
MDVLKRNLDGMEAVKMNVFHWHLSDDQGFRAESRVFPLLQQKGSDGLFYTQEQMREIVLYARDRGIRVVPEFDMPGHVTAWLVGYPELGSGSGPYAIERKWGIFDPALDPTQESTYAFLDKLIAEMSAIFPDAYFHIGGDECNGEGWKANAKIREFMRAHGYKTTEELQGYFSRRVLAIVAAHGKLPAGWDEILQPDTAKNALIQSWNGPRSLLSAARQGNDVILSKGYYIDLNHSAADHYRIDPAAGLESELTPEQERHILGGESTMWSEFVSGETIDSRIWPRNAAIAERLWSPAAMTQDVESMYRRLACVSRHLEDYKLQHRAVYPRMLQRIAGTDSTASLKVLADVVEPPKDYERGELRQYDAFVPLNRLVDAVPPESMIAREFSQICARIADRTATESERQRAHSLLLLWKQNDAALAPLLQRTDLTMDLAPLSASLRDVAQIGLEALDRIERHASPDSAWRDASLRSLQAAAKPQATLLLVVVPSVSVLVEAAAPTAPAVGTQTSH